MDLTIAESTVSFSAFERSQGKQLLEDARGAKR
jgi:hypothetical protein